MKSSLNIFSITILLTVTMFALTAKAQTACYTVDAIPYNPDSYELGDPVQLGDDQFSSAIEIGFDFCFFEETYQYLLIGSNGIISFNMDLESTNCAYAINTALPSGNEIDAMNAIMCPWHDMNPSAGGTIKYATYGISPARRFIISYLNVPMYGCSDSLISSQVAIFEGSNVVEMYIDTNYYCPTSNGGNAIFGLQDATGTDATWANNWNYPTQWEAFEEAYRFSPQCSCAVDSTGNQVFGKVYLENNEDCVIDPGEVGIPFAMVEIQPTNTVLWTNANGAYQTTVAQGQFEVSHNPTEGFTQVCPANSIYSFDTTDFGAVFTQVDFGDIISEGNCYDLSVTMANSGIGNCQLNNHAVSYCNNGNTEIENTQVIIEFNALSGITQSSIPYTVLGGGTTVSFDLGTLSPMQCGTFTFTDTIACEFGAGNLICYNVAIIPNINDCDPADNTYFNCQTTQFLVSGNHKLIRDMQSLNNGLVETTNWTYSTNLPFAEYTIRFQNTTQQNQQNLWITDPISQYLNIGTLEPLASSHAYDLTYTNGELRFNFADINLPPSSENEDASKGFVTYKIRLDSTVTDQVSIPNMATVHFGENEEINTNTAIINAQPNSIVELGSLAFNISPNPSTGNITIQIAGGISKATYQVLDMQGRTLKSGSITQSEIIDLSAISSGSYLFRISQDGKVGVERLIKN